MRETHIFLEKQTFWYKRKVSDKILLHKKEVNSFFLISYVLLYKYIDKWEKFSETLLAKKE